MDKNVGKNNFLKFDHYINIKNTWQFDPTTLSSLKSIFSEKTTAAINKHGHKRTSPPRTVQVGITI